MPSRVDVFLSFSVHEFCDLIGQTRLKKSHNLVSPNMRGFASQGLWHFPDAIFNFLFLNLSMTIGGTLVGFSSVKDVDIVQSDLK